MSNVNNDVNSLVVYTYKVAGTVKIQIQSVCQLYLIAMVFLIDLGDGHILIVAAYIGSDSLWNEGSRNRFGMAIHIIPLVIDVKFDFGSVAQVNIIFNSAMIAVHFDTGNSGIGKILFHKSVHGFRQCLSISCGSCLSSRLCLNHHCFYRSCRLNGRYSDLLLIGIVVTGTRKEKNGKRANRQ